MSISTASNTSTTIKRYRYVAVGSETSISGVDANGNVLSYTPGVEQVYLNGVLQVRGSDYTATTGTTITALAALVANDVVEIVTFGVFTVATALGAAQTSAPDNPVEGQIWLDTDGSTADTAFVPKSTVTTAGDLIYATGSGAVTRLGVGSTGQLLTVADGAPTWAAAPAAGSSWSLLNTGGTALTGAATITVSGISGKDKIMVLVADASSASASNILLVRFNTDTGSNYYQYGFKSDVRGTYDAGTQSKIWANANSGIWLAEMGVSDATAAGFVLITGCNSAGVKVYSAGGGSTYQGSQATQTSSGGYYNSASTISSVSITTAGGNWDNGTVYVYTSA